MLASWRLSHIMDLKARFRETYPLDEVKRIANIPLTIERRLAFSGELGEAVAFYRAKIALEARIATVAIPNVLDLTPGSLYGIGCKKIYDKRYGYIGHSMPSKREAIAGQGLLLPMEEIDFGMDAERLLDMRLLDIRDLNKDH